MSGTNHDLIDKFDEVKISKKGGTKQEEALFDKEELQLEEHIDEGLGLAPETLAYIEARNRNIVCLYEVMKALGIDQTIEDL